MGCGSSLDEAHLARMRMNGGLSGGGSSMLGGSNNSALGGGGDGGGSYLPSQIPTIIVTPPSVLPPPDPPMHPNPNGPPPPQPQQQQQPQSKGGTTTAGTAAGAGGAGGAANKTEQAQFPGAAPDAGAFADSAAAASSAAAAAAAPSSAASAAAAASHTPHAPSDTFTGAGSQVHPHQPHHAHAQSMSAGLTDRHDGASSPEQLDRDRARSSSGSNHSYAGMGSGVHTPPTASAAASAAAYTAAAAASSALASAAAVHSGHSSRSPSAGSMHSSLTIQTAVISANRANHSGEGGQPRYVISDRGGSRGPQSRSSGFSHPAQPESPSIKPRQIRGGGGGDDPLALHSNPISPQGTRHSRPFGHGHGGHGLGIGSTDAAMDGDGAERIFEFANNNEHVIIPGIDMTADDPLADESDEMRVHGRNGAGGGATLSHDGSNASNASGSDEAGQGQILPLSSSPPLTHTMLSQSQSHSSLQPQPHSPPPTKHRDENARGSIYSPPADRSREVSVASSIGDEGSVLALAAAAATKQTRMGR